MLERYRYENAEKESPQLVFIMIADSNSDLSKRFFLIHALDSLMVETSLGKNPSDSILRVFYHMTVG